MKKLGVFVLALFLATTANYASEDTTWGTLKTLVDQAPIPAAKAAAKSVANVYEFGNPANIIALEGSSLTRMANGVTMNLQTTGLVPGDAVTVWWVVWNDPDECTDDCGEDDLGIAGNDVLRAAGRIIGGNGNGNFNGHLQVGDTSESLFPYPVGLTNPGGAEIHLVVRTHGPAIPGSIPMQIHTVEDGCDPAVCNDVQAAVHQP